MQALLGTAPHFCQAVVLKLRSVPLGKKNEDLDPESGDAGVVQTRVLELDARGVEKEHLGEKDSGFQKRS